MLKTIVQILIGWSKKYNVIETTQAEQKLSELRMEKCLSCNEAKKSKVLRIINGEGRHEDELKCSICKCPCIQATLVVEKKCPINKW